MRLLGKIIPSPFLCFNVLFCEIFLRNDLSITSIRCCYDDLGHLLSFAPVFSDISIIDLQASRLETKKAMTANRLVGLAFMAS